MKSPEIPKIFGIENFLGFFAISSGLIWDFSGFHWDYLAFLGIFRAFLGVLLDFSEIYLGLFWIFLDFRDFLGLFGILLGMGNPKKKQGKIKPEIHKGPVSTNLRPYRPGPKKFFAGRAVFVWYLDQVVWSKKSADRAFLTWDFSW